MLEGIPLLLPPNKLVVEILERVEITEEVVAACKELKRQGYLLALDDFVLSDNNAQLIEFSDIIKVEFSKIPVSEQRLLLKEYDTRVKFLAEKVETADEYHLALRMGYNYFQGYFFSKPVMMGAKEIGTLVTALSLSPASFPNRIRTLKPSLPLLNAMLSCRTSCCALPIQLIMGRVCRSRQSTTHWFSSVYTI